MPLRHFGHQELGSEPMKVRALFAALAACLSAAGGCSCGRTPVDPMPPRQLQEHRYKTGHLAIGMSEPDVWEQVRGCSTNPSANGPYLAIVDDPDPDRIRLAFDDSTSGSAGWVELVMSNQTVTRIRMWTRQHQ